uniref:FMN-binding protein n=1 Tax=Coprococcus catus TaxID=116085 RepID=UPI0022E5C129|nr:FMN-binding protein [Coprococcus catus]
MKGWKRFGNYMPMLATVAVVGCVAMALKGYAAPVYEVEQPETFQSAEADAKEKKQETEETEQAKKGNFDLADGFYKGSGTGFAGTVSVSVEIKDKSIVAINILSTQDDEAFFNRAKGVIDKIIAGQILDVDVVSGATYSSNGIISAVKNALTGEQDTSTPATTASSSNQSSPSIETVDDSNQTWKDGTYYGSGTGFNGEVQVEVVIADGKISNISVVSHNDDSSFMSQAQGLIPNIISSQSTNVDAVSGATYSSRGIINAVRAALKQAAVNGSSNDADDSNDDNNNNDNNNSNNNSTIVEGKVPYEEGIYYGTGEGYAGDIQLAVVIQDKTIKAILVTECEDDAAFFNRAKSIINEVLKNQSTDLSGIDTVSGATYSSNGIVEALREAFKAAENGNSGKPAESETETETESETETDNKDSIYIDGAYTVSVVCEPDEDQDFEAYNLSMTVHIKDDKITAVTDIVGDGGSSNDSYIKRAAEGTSKLPGVVTQITKKGSPEEIDTVTRATCSSNAIIEGCQKALEAAKRTPEETDETEPGETETEKPTNRTYADGAYTVSVICEPDADGHFDAYDLTMTVRIENDKITDISDISGNGDSSNDRYITRAAQGTSKSVGVVTQITEKGMPEGIDTVARATCSSNAIIEGCQKALDEAKKLAEEGK